MAPATGIRCEARDGWPTFTGDNVPGGGDPRGGADMERGACLVCGSTTPVYSIEERGAAPRDEDFSALATRMRDVEPLALER